jgi:uncharacterized protein with FMN-binding domain
MFPKRGAVALVATVLGLVLLLSFKTPDVATVEATVRSDRSAVSSPLATPGSSGGGTAGTTASAAPAATSATTAAAATTITGSTVSTRYGDVAVEVTLASGRITAVRAISLPSGGRSGQISASAGPVLASEALTAQNASIDIVSGATYTSQAYAQSLQAALDQAAIGTTAVNG